MGRNQYTTDYTYKGIIMRLRGLEQELDRTPTTRDADDDDVLPALDTIYRVAGKGWNEILDDAGMQSTQVERYSDDEKDDMMSDIQRVFAMQNTGYLTSRAYADEGEYATSTIKEHFGSWSEACDEANVPSGSRHGNQCCGPKGATLDSYQEQRCAFLLHSLDIKYEVHKQIPETNWISDFYLPNFDLWIEIDGYVDGTRPNSESFARKLCHYESHGYDYVVASNPTDLKNQLFT